MATLGIVALVAVVAVSSRGSTSSGGDGVRGPTDTLLDILLSFYIVLLVAGAILFLYLLVLNRTLRARGDAGRRDWRNAVGLLVLLAAAALLTRDFSSRRLAEIGVTLPEAAGGGDAGAAPGGGDAYEAEFAWIPVSIALGLAALAVGGLWWARRARRRARGELGRDPFAAAVAVAVDESLDDLRAEPDPRRAVIAAYARLERVLASHGLPRRTSEAPLEYLGRMLAVLSVGPAAARTLTGLFERAKFSQHAVGPEMKEQAIGALETVRDDLAAARTRAEAERAASLEPQRARATT
jgi:hypothetical protein